MIPTPLPASWSVLWETYEVLRKPSISPRTMANYREAMVDLARFLERCGQVPPLEELTRRHIAAYLDDMAGRVAPATVGNRFRALRAVFGWLARPQDDDEPYLERDPVAGVHPAQERDRPVAVLSVDEVRRLLATCRTGDFEGRRDEAMIRMLYDSGVRRGELASMRVDWLNLQEGTAMVSGKTGPRVVAFGPRTGAALLRYKRLREKRAKRGQVELWLGHKGPLSGNGIYQALQRRFEAAGVEAEKMVHVFRHTFGHRFRAAGGSEGDLMELAGWSTPTMAHRYGRSAAQERARATHRRLGLGDDL